MIKEVKQEQGEPVAYFNPQDRGFHWAKPTKVVAPITVDVELLPLYTTPQQRKPLTDEQIMEMVFAECDNMRWPSTALYIARAIEAAHGIKE